MHQAKPRGSVQTQFAHRQTAIKMILSGEFSSKQIAHFTGFSDGSIRNLASKLNHKNIKLTSAPAKRGKPEGVGALLSPRQCRTIVRLIRDKTPQQLKLNFMLWSIGMVMALIKQRFNIVVAESTMRSYLKDWGFSVQRPTGRYSRRDDVVIEQWINEVYPQIHERAKAEGLEIHWLDETGVDNQNAYLRGLSPKGQTPLVVPSKRKRINVLSTVSAKGTLRFRVYEGTLNQQRFIGFLDGLCKDAGKKILVMMDNLPLHKGLAVREWLALNHERIEVYYLPPYAPERNPDEYLNQDLKSNVHRKGDLLLNKSELKKKVVGCLRSIQKKAERVAGYFQTAYTRYAAV